MDMVGTVNIELWAVLLGATKEELKELRCAVRVMVQNFIGFAKSRYGCIANKTFKGIKREYVLGLLVRINTLQANGTLKKEE